MQSTFNITIISIADTNGNVVSGLRWSKGFKGSRKSTPYAAQIAADAAASKALEYGMKTLTVEIKGPGSGRETALRALQRGFKILSIKIQHQCHIMEQGHQKKESLMETENVNIKNWKSLIKPSKLDVKLSDDLTHATIIAEPKKKVTV